MAQLQSYAELARVHARERPDAPAITFEGRTLTYSDLDRRSNQVAQALSADGVGPDDRVAFLDKNTPEYFEVVIGAGKLNAVTVAVNWRLAPQEMLFIINDAEAKVLVVGQEFIPHIDEIREKLDTVTRVLTLGDEYEAWLDGQPAEDPGVQPQLDDIAVQLYTSGTTGLPKGAMLTNRNLFGLMPVGSEAWRFTPDSVNLVVMPLFHIAGSGWGTVGLYNGCHNIMLRDVDPPAILRVIPQFGVTNAIFVPAVLQFLLMTPGIEATDMSTLRVIVYGASPISREILVRSLKAFGCEFAQAYGLTETTGGVVILPPEDHDPDGPSQHRLRAAGKAWGDVELRIVNPETLEDMPTGEVGEVWIRTVQNMKGYWRRPEETAKAFAEGGWFRSGDAGYLDADGYLYIHDRVKDMIISGGENIYPAEVENVLMSHPDVADAAVIGVPDEKWGEAVKAIIVRAEGSAIGEADIIGYCRERLAHYKCPKSIDWAEMLPRNPSGKILKKDLREPYWRGLERRVH